MVITKSRTIGVSFVALCLAVWLHAANSMLAATTLPSAVRELGGGHLLGWAFALYLLGSILAGAMTGVLTRRMDIRTCLLSGAGLYLFGCAVCAMAPDMTIVLSGRLLQGLGGGFMVALCFVAVSRWYDDSLYPKLMAMISAVWSTSAFCGPLVGGTFATWGDWRWAFWAFALQALLFIAACLWLLPREAATSTHDKAARLPVVRLVILTLAILSVASAGAWVDAVRSPLLCLLAVGLLILVFRQDARRRDSAMFPRRPLTLSSPLGAGLIFVLSASVATMSFLVYGPILLETLHGVTPFVAGYIVAFESICWGLAAVFIARFGHWPDRVLIRLGALVITAGSLGLALSMANGPLVLIILSAACQGAGFGLCWAFVIKRIAASADDDETDVAAAAIPTLQQIGFAMGAAAAGIVANAAGFGAHVTAENAMLAAPWLFAAFLPFLLVAMMGAWRMTAEM